jgi:hypothetical protein
MFTFARQANKTQMCNMIHPTSQGCPSLKNFSRVRANDAHVCQGPESSRTQESEEKKSMQNKKKKKKRKKEKKKRALNTFPHVQANHKKRKAAHVAHVRSPAPTVVEARVQEDAVLRLA